MRYISNFWKEVPLEKRELVSRKIEDFGNLLLASKSLADIPKGFWIRKVRNTDVYKFRVNTGDRILFTYMEDTILFISFQKHDKQIRAAKAYRKAAKPVIDLQIDERCYEELDKQEEKIDLYVVQEIQAQLMGMQQQVVIEDEYIALSIEENDMDQMHYLSLEQYDCLTELEKPIIVLGCAGSGKTMIAIRKCLLNETIGLSTLYMTGSNAIVYKTKSMFERYDEANTSVSFTTFREFCAAALNIEMNRIVQYKGFSQWFQHSAVVDKRLSMSAMEIWLEINTFIKGETDGGVLLKKEAYFQSASTLACDKKRKLYKIAEQYQHWLDSNHYYDDNDLAFLLLSKPITFPFDYFIYDEVQELSKRQLRALVHCIKDRSKVMFLGDIHQCIETYDLNVASLKHVLAGKHAAASEHFITKNYRNPFELVSWINALKDTVGKQFKSFSSELMLEEVAIRFGQKPHIVRVSGSMNSLFQKIDKDVNSIIIVVDEHQKEALQQTGVATGRVFTVSEVRGLEYNNVYVYNFMTHYKEVWEKTLETDTRVNELYRVYYNMLYIAATRAKDQIYFLEHESTSLEKVLASYCVYEQDLTSILSEDVQYEANDWLAEARKLQQLEKYEQAAKAFEKAGDIEQARNCMQAHDLQLNYNYGREQASYITIHSDIITEKEIREVLTYLAEIYDVTISGYIQVYVIYLNPPKYRIDVEYISPDSTYEEAACLIGKSYSRGYLHQNFLGLRVHARQGNHIVDLANLFQCGGQRDVCFTFRQNQLSCKIGTETALKELDDVKEREICLIDGVSGTKHTPSPMTEVQTKRKYEGSTPQDMLDFLRSGKL